MKANKGAEARAIEAMLGSEEMRDRFLATTFALLARESDVLQKATPLSIVDAIKTAASMGLEPMTSDGAIVVYGNKATFLPMWQGYLKRIRNSGHVHEVDTQLVYEHDLFELRLGTDPQIDHVPAKIVKNDDGEVIADRGGYLGAYAWALMATGKYIIEFMSEDEINLIRDQYGNKKGPSPWQNAWGEMARKTVLRRLAKRLPGEAVEKLLRVEAEVDRLQDEVKETKDEMEGLRRLAYQAVSPTPTPQIAPEAPTAPEPVEPLTSPEAVA
jgi:recombination protein RecT